MLYLRSATLKEKGAKKDAKIYIRCEFSVGKSKLSKTYPVNIFKDGSNSSQFAMLQKAYELDTTNETVVCLPNEILSAEDLYLEGDFFDVECKRHFVLDSNGDKIKAEKDDESAVDGFVTTNRLRGACVTEWGMSPESIVRSFERSWANDDLLAEKEDQLNAERNLCL